MEQYEEIEYTKEELMKMAPNFGFKIIESKNQLELKSILDFKRKENAGVLLYLLISFIPFCLLVVSEGLFVKVAMVLIGGFFLVLSILTLMKQHSDFLILDSTKLKAENSLNRIKLESDECETLWLRRSTDTFKSSRNSRGTTYRIIELMAKTSTDEIRIFDFMGETRFQEQVDQLGDYLLELAKEKLLITTGDTP